MTAEAAPLEQRFVVGAVALRVPAAVPQEAAASVALHVAEAPPLDPLHDQAHGPLPVTALGLPVTHNAAPDGAAVSAWVLAAPHTPGTAALQAPAPLHCPPAQAVPGALFCPLPQTTAPVEQLTTPLTHSPPAFDVHEAPSVQLRQTPLPVQTPPAQAVPAPFALPSTQDGAPPTHEVTPVRQGLGLPVQAAPGVHATQAPLPLQTPPLHELPAVRGEPLTHAAVPDVQSTTPR